MHGRTKGSCSRSATETGETEHLSKGPGRGGERKPNIQIRARPSPPSRLTALRTLFEELSSSRALPKCRARTVSEHRASHCRGRDTDHRGSAGRDQGPGQGCHPPSASAPPHSCCCPCHASPRASFNPRRAPREGAGLTGIWKKADCAAQGPPAPGAFLAHGSSAN